jgi:hypothetical protein
MEGQDPQEHYQLDLMTDDRSVDNAHRMTLAYVNFSRKLLSTTKSSFLRDLNRPGFTGG